MKFIKYITLSLAIAALTAVSSQAATITYQITSDHATGGLGTAPFGTVTLTESGTSTLFNVTLTSGYSFVKTGSADFQYFKFNATGVVVGDITVTQNQPGQTLSAGTGAFNGDGTGNFSFGITSTAGNGGAGAFSGPILFSVANSTIADFTIANNLGNLFVADLLAPNGNTGPADVTATRVPDAGMTLALLGAALAGVEVLRRTVLKRSPAA